MGAARIALNRMADPESGRYYESICMYKTRQKKMTCTSVKSQDSWNPRPTERPHGLCWGTQLWKLMEREISYSYMTKSG